MSSVYERLINLFSQTGLNVETGSYAEAEAYAYAAGLAAVREIIDGAKNAIFFSLDEDCNLKHYAVMLGLDSELFTDDVLEELIVTRLSHSYGAPQLTDAYLDEEQFIGNAYILGSGSNYTVNEITADCIPSLGRFLIGAVPCDREVVLGGNGLTFQQWGRLQKTFRFFDRLMLPFSVLDTMQTDLIN